MLTCEASKLSAVTAAAVESASGPKRSSALPATRQMVLERQVRFAVVQCRVWRLVPTRIVTMYSAVKTELQVFFEMLMSACGLQPGNSSTQGVTCRGGA